MVYSLNGNPINKAEIIRLRRSTHEYCLNCGICSEEYRSACCNVCNSSIWGNLKENIEIQMLYLSDKPDKDQKIQILIQKYEKRRKT